MNVRFTKYSTIYYIVSGILVLATIVCMAVFGLKFGIEFAGGSSMQVEFSLADGGQRPPNDAIQNALAQFNLGQITIQPTGADGAILQFIGVDEATHQQILAKLNELTTTSEKSFQYVGPSVGQELRNKTELAIFLALLAITLYIAFAFRKVSRPVNSWKYGIASLIALFHDILIPLGMFSVLGKMYNVEITIPIIAALLTVLGFSVHDTIVIFDRIRENILTKGTGSFSDTVDNSLNQTIGRSISTVITVLLVMVSLFFFGGQTLKYFSLAIIIGIFSGAYSSIFIAGPLLVTWKKWDDKRATKRKKR